MNAPYLKTLRDSLEEEFGFVIPIKAKQASKEQMLSFYEHFRSLADLENELLNTRMSWLLGFNGLLITAAVLAIGPIFELQDPALQTKVFSFIIVFAIVLMAWGLTWRSSLSIRGSETAIRRIYLDWLLFFVTDKELKGTGGDTLEALIEERMNEYPRVLGIGMYPDPLRAKTRSRFWTESWLFIFIFWLLLLIASAFFIFSL